jgi:thioredoxin 1
MGNLIHLTDATFESEVIKSDKPVLIDFWATWCAPCRLIAPHVEAIAEEYAGKVKVMKLDVDNNQNTARILGIRSIPTLMIFKNGEVVGNIVGAVPKHKIEEHLQSVL